jgi:hypothetical protein
MEVDGGLSRPAMGVLFFLSSQMIAEAASYLRLAAGSLLSSAMRADWSLTARLDEHRLSNNTIDLVCAFGEHERPTALVALSVVEPKLGAG